MMSVGGKKNFKYAEEATGVLVVLTMTVWFMIWVCQLLDAQNYNIPYKENPQCVKAVKMMEDFTND